MAWIPCHGDMGVLDERQLLWIEHLAFVHVGHVLAVGDAKGAVDRHHARTADVFRPPAHMRHAVFLGDPPSFDEDDVNGGWDGTGGIQRDGAAQVNPGVCVRYSRESTGSRQQQSRKKLGSQIVNSDRRPIHSFSNGWRCPNFTRRRVSSRSSRLRRNGVSLGHSPISAAVLPQPRHHPVFGSRRQTSMHGDCTRLALRFMEEPRLEFPCSRS